MRSEPDIDQDVTDFGADAKTPLLMVHLPMRRTLVEVKTISLTEAGIASALAGLQKSLSKYLEIQKRAEMLADACLDPAFRKSYNGYYRVRRDDAWRQSYFGLMRGLRGGESFRTNLTEFYRLTGRVEASFVSKMMATIDPRLPVIDSIVLKTLSLRLLYVGGAEMKIERACHVHDCLVASFAAFLASPAGRDAIAVFRSVFPAAKVTDEKILDFSLWRTGSSDGG